jgi:hypothetical protein
VFFPEKHARGLKDRDKRPQSIYEGEKPKEFLANIEKSCPTRAPPSWQGAQRLRWERGNCAKKRSRCVMERID